MQRLYQILRGCRYTATTRVIIEFSACSYPGFFQLLGCDQQLPLGILLGLLRRDQLFCIGFPAPGLGFLFGAGVAGCGTLVSSLETVSGGMEPGPSGDKALGGVTAVGSSELRRALDPLVIRWLRLLVPGPVREGMEYLAKPHFGGKYELTDNDQKLLSIVIYVIYMLLIGKEIVGLQNRAEREQTELFRKAAARSPGENLEQ